MKALIRLIIIVGLQAAIMPGNANAQGAEVASTEKTIILTTDEVSDINCENYMSSLVDAIEELRLSNERLAMIVAAQQEHIEKQSDELSRQRRQLLEQQKDNEELKRLINELSATTKR